MVVTWKDKVLAWLSRVTRFFVANKLFMKLYELMLWHQVKNGEIPRHIAVILDGNRRWASSKGLNVFDGHYEGAKKAEKFLEWCLELGKVQTVTLYAFSTENFKRSREEINHIFSLMEDYLNQLHTEPKIFEKKVRVKVLGRIENLPENLRNIIRKIEALTEKHSNYYLNLAIAYGGRAEIVDAVKSIASKVAEKKLSIEEINEKTIEEHLYTSFLPNPYPDLIIRTSGEERLSNFLLWQSAYSELCFLDVYWPSFRKIDFLRAIRVYQQRQRRFGA